MNILCLFSQGTLSDSFQKILSSYDYSSAVTKINGTIYKILHENKKILICSKILLGMCYNFFALFLVALKGLPQFSASPAGYDPSPSSSSPGPHHRTTIHLNTESMEQIHRSSLDYLQGKWSQKYIL